MLSSAQDSLIQEYRCTLHGVEGLLRLRVPTTNDSLGWLQATSNTTPLATQGGRH